MSDDVVVGYAAEALKRGDIVVIEMSQCVPAEMAKLEPEAFAMAKKRPIPMVKKVSSP